MVLGCGRTDDCSINRIKGYERFEPVRDARGWAILVTQQLGCSGLRIVQCHNLATSIFDQHLCVMPPHPTATENCKLCATHCWLKLLRVRSSVEGEVQMLRCPFARFDDPLTP
jgi:hypothetical protein